MRQIATALLLFMVGAGCQAAQSPEAAASGAAGIGGALSKPGPSRVAKPPTKVVPVDRRQGLSIDRGLGPGDKVDVVGQKLDEREQDEPVGSPGAAPVGRDEACENRACLDIKPVTADDFGPSCEAYCECKEQAALGDTRRCTKPEGCDCRSLNLTGR